MKTSKVFSTSLLLTWATFSQASPLKTIKLININKVTTHAPERSTLSSTQFIRDTLSGEATRVGLNKQPEKVHFELSCEAYIFPTGSIQNFSQIKIIDQKKAKAESLAISNFSDCERSLAKLKVEKETTLNIVSK